MRNICQLTRDRTSEEPRKPDKHYLQWWLRLRRWMAMQAWGWCDDTVLSRVTAPVSHEVAAAAMRRWNQHYYSLLETGSIWIERGMFGQVIRIYDITPEKEFSSCCASQRS